MALKYINGLIIEEEERVRMSQFHFYYSVLSHRDLDRLVSFSLIISMSGKGFLHRILMQEETLENVKPQGRFTRRKKTKKFFSDIQKKLRAGSTSWERLSKVIDPSFEVQYHLGQLDEAGRKRTRFTYFQYETMEKKLFY